jgi:hypothetical protein
MLSALDCLPVKELIAGDLQDGESVCAIGAVGRARGLDMTKLDPEDAETIAVTFGIAKAMARELVFENDDEFGLKSETPAERYQRMRKWIESQIREGLI